MSFDPVDLIASSTHKKIANTGARLIANCMQKVWNFKHAKINKSQQAQVKTTNGNQRPSSDYKVEDLVWLSTNNIHTKKLLKKTRPQENILTELSN